MSDIGSAVKRMGLAPPRSFVFSPYFPIVKSMEDVLGLGVCMADKDRGVVIAMIWGLGSSKMIEGAFSGGDSDMYVKLIGEYANDVDPEKEGSEKWMQELKANVTDNPTNTISLAINLISAFKKSELEPSHMSSFFASFGTDNISNSSLVKMMNAIRPFLPMISRDDGYLSIRHNNAFMDYRENLVSWPSLYRDCRSVIGFCFADDHKYASADGRDPDSMTGMPMSDMCILAAYLEACDKYPPKWHQGNKAIKSCNPTRYDTLVRAFKKLNSMMTDAKLIEAADDLDSLKEALAKMVKS